VRWARDDVSVSWRMAMPLRHRLARVSLAGWSAVGMWEEEAQRRYSGHSRIASHHIPELGCHRGRRMFERCGHPGTVARLITPMILSGSERLGLRSTFILADRTRGRFNEWARASFVRAP
jgi:hypothetical protein